MKEDFFAELEADAKGSDVENFNQEGLQTIAEIARAVREKQEYVEALEGLLKKAKAELLKLTDEDLPNMIMELGVRDFTLEDGSKVELKTTYGAHIKIDNRDQAFEWLKTNGYDDIIKNVTSCQFGRGEDDRAVDFVKLAEAQGLPITQKREVHPNTLKAFVRERVEAGDDFPMELFGAFVGQRATIKGSKTQLEQSISELTGLINALIVANARMGELSAGQINVDADFLSDLNATSGTQEP